MFLAKIRKISLIKVVVVYQFLAMKNRKLLKIYSQQVNRTKSFNSTNLLQRTGSVKSSSAFSNQELNADAFLANERYNSSI